MNAFSFYKDFMRELEAVLVHQLSTNNIWNFWGYLNWKLFHFAQSLIKTKKIREDSKEIVLKNRKKKKKILKNQAEFVQLQKR